MIVLFWSRMKTNFLKTIPDIKYLLKTVLIMCKLKSRMNPNNNELQTKQEIRKLFFFRRHKNILNLPPNKATFVIISYSFCDRHAFDF